MHAAIVSNVSTALRHRLNRHVQLLRFCVGLSPAFSKKRKFPPSAKNGWSVLHPCSAVFASETVVDTTGEICCGRPILWFGRSRVVWVRLQDAVNDSELVFLQVICELCESLAHQPSHPLDWSATGSQHLESTVGKPAIQSKRSPWPRWP